MNIRTIIGIALLALLISAQGSRAACQLQSQPAPHGNLASVPSASSEKSTKVWTSNGQANENIEHTDKSGCVHQIHRWVDKNGNNHETDQWTDTDDNVNQCHRWIDSSKTVHETKHITDKTGKVTVSHVQKDKNGVVTDCSDKVNDSHSKPAGVNPHNSDQGSAAQPNHGPAPVVQPVGAGQGTHLQSNQPAQCAQPAHPAQPAQPANNNNVAHAVGCPNANLQQNH